MTILILEDNAERIVAFRRNFSKYELTIVHHAKDAINQMKDKMFDYVFLDHDLGGKQMDWDPEDCGMVVATWMNETNYRPVNGTIIHSFNASRAMIMKHLTNGVYMPGIWLKEG